MSWVPLTNQMVNARREEHCVGITSERKYYRIGHTFVKRSLRPSEWQMNPHAGTIIVPRSGRERVLNEAASMAFIAEHTNIPVPKLHCCFEDAEAVYLVTENVEGTRLQELNDEQRAVVAKELETHLQTMKGLTSKSWGGPSGLVVPPYRLMAKSPRQEWKMKPLESADLVFCHNDLSTTNVIVDPDTLKVKAIIDWEYAGFYPPQFEMRFFTRVGPSAALAGEADDVSQLLEIMERNRVKEV